MPGIWPQYPSLPRAGAAAHPPQRHPMHGWSVKWVAGPPPKPVEGDPDAEEPDAEGDEGPYEGPPRYPAPPRWGFPMMPWRPASAVGAQREPRTRAAVLAGAGTSASTVVASFALVAFIAGVLEFWRYGLFAASRYEALSTASVTTSNALASTFAVSAAIIGAAGIGLTVRWFLLARAEAGALHGVVLPRTSRQVLARLCGVWVVLAVVALLTAIFRLADPLVVIIGPVLIGGAVIASAVTAGPVVAELEHVVLGRRPGATPRPSRTVLLWWAVWVLNTGCAATALWLRMRPGIQAQADAMYATALTHLAAAAVAVVTVVLMHRIGRLLAPPPKDVDRYRVVDVQDAPAPPVRTGRPATSPR